MYTIMMALVNFVCWEAITINKLYSSFYASIAIEKKLFVKCADFFYYKLRSCLNSPKPEWMIKEDYEKVFCYYLY